MELAIAYPPWSPSRQPCAGGLVTGLFRHLCLDAAWREPSRRGALLRSRHSVPPIPGSPLTALTLDSLPLHNRAMEGSDYAFACLHCWPR